MKEERWEEIVEMIERKFDLIEHETVPLEPSPGQEERVVFNGPLGKMMLTRVTKPRVEGKRVMGSRRIGSEVTEETVYSETEQTHTLFAYQWNTEKNDWEEIEAGDSLPFS